MLLPLLIKIEIGVKKMDIRQSAAIESKTIINFGVDASLPFTFIKGFSGGETTQRLTVSANGFSH